MATVRLPGGPTLSYQEWGRPDGAVVLMLHGLESSGDELAARRSGRSASGSG